MPNLMLGTSLSSSSRMNLSFDAPNNEPSASCSNATNTSVNSEANAIGNKFKKMLYVVYLMFFKCHRFPYIEWIL